MHPLERYLRELHAIRSTGAATPETSYYAPLENLLNEVGGKLRPKVRCVSHAIDVGAGFPDFGLYSAEQFQKARDAEPIPGQPPERGVVEAKPPRDDSWMTADGEQVTRYWGQYGQVLVTNYRSFLLVGRDARGEFTKLESLSFAETEAALWNAAAHPRQAATEYGDRLVEYLQRVLLHPAPITDPGDVAWFLACYAREARDRIADLRELPGLKSVRDGLESALGMKFEGEAGEHFFRATLVQTLFYGVFSAWVISAQDNLSHGREATFNWHESSYDLSVPIIASFFHKLVDPGTLRGLGLSDLLDWTGNVLNRVDQARFFERFEQGSAVQYFYEPFLKAYDPPLRKELGVWFTPHEIVSYQVRRIDKVLRDELQVEDGLADQRVYVLDPCCGTGAYLVEVLRQIHEALRAKGGGALVPQKVKRAAMQRVFGFEILPAPFIVSHLQLGIFLLGIGAPLSVDDDERAAVYLTNALTGWEGSVADKQVVWPELAAERDAAGKIKREAPILVVLGNPPYNAFAGTTTEEEEGLVEPYKKGLVPEWGIRKYNLDDLYVRFFRLAERRILRTGRGVVSYISNFSYIDKPSFVVMREHLLREFDGLWLDCMNGDSRETGKKTPDGEPDPSVFSTELNREGIKQGTAVCLFVRCEERGGSPVVRYRDFWGVSKRQELLASLGSSDFDGQYRLCAPTKANRFSLRPSVVSDRYRSWPRITDLCKQSPSNGLMEKRRGALIDIDKAALSDRMQKYLAPDVSWKNLSDSETRLTRDAAGFDAQKTRAKILQAETEAYDGNRIREYALRPFDTRWCYYSAFHPLWNRPRPTYFAQCWDGNSFLMTRPMGVASPEGVPFFHTHLLGDNDFLRGHAYYFPCRLRRLPEARSSTDGTDALFAGTEQIEVANLSAGARRYLSSLGFADPDKDRDVAALLWMHALAVGYSPAYLTEHSQGIRSDWPRIPLPGTKERLSDSAELGAEVAKLLDIRSKVLGVTAGEIRPELEKVGVIHRAGGGPIDLACGELEVTAGWGHPGKAGAIMPGGGRMEERAYSDLERFAIKKGASALGLDPAEVLGCLGDETQDVYLNDVAYWRNVPSRVWQFRIGGNQVIKKWLSYRESTVLGRSLGFEEVDYVEATARRIAALLLLQPALDENYRAASEENCTWHEED